MSQYSELVEKFYLRYEQPTLEELTVGFSGIDPPLKTEAQSIGDHETLDNLMGGNSNGHYHLTARQIERLRDYLGSMTIDEGFASTPESEYETTKYMWLNGGYSAC